MIKSNGKLIKTIVGVGIMGVIGGLIGYVCENYRAEKKARVIRRQSEKHLYLFKMMVEWMALIQDGKSISDYITNKGIRRIAVYGVSYVGDCLIRELKNTEWELIYGIDNAENTIWTDIPVFSMNDELEDVDIVIVTAVTNYEEIQKELFDKINSEVISLEEIIYQIRSK